MSVYVTINDKQVRGLFREFPKIANSEVNRGYNRTVVAFMKDFTRQKLRPGYFNPKRKVNLKNPPKGQPKIAQKARKAGFVAKLYGVTKLKGKAVRVKNSSPLMLIREYPKPIYPKDRDKGYLVIRGDPKKAFGRGKKAAARRSSWQSRSAAQRRPWTKPVVAKVKMIRPFPPLGFQVAWKRYRAEVLRRMDETTKQIVRRAERQFARKAA